MNHLKANPKGIDKVIERLQTYLYTKISANYSLTDFEAYGRIYKNKKDGKIIPEFYASETEYEDVLLDDRISGIMFFVPSDIYTSDGGFIIRECDVLFTFDLSKLSSQGNATRDDEEVRDYILTLFHNDKNTIDYQVHTGLKNVYKDFTGVAEYFKDMQPFHHFKVRFELRYYLNNC